MFERLVMAEKTRQCLCLCFSLASGQIGAEINSSSGPRLLGKDNERYYSGKQLTLTPFSLNLQCYIERPDPIDYVTRWCGQ